MPFKCISVNWSKDNSGIKTYFASFYGNVAVQTNNKGSFPGE